MTPTQQQKENKMTNQNYINTTSNKDLNTFYLDYVNNYVTAARMAEDYALSVEETLELLAKGKEINNTL
jgi:NaMN:DMB phosphoribosyltransferase